METLVRVTWWVLVLLTVQTYSACIPSNYQDIHTPILHKCTEFNKKAETTSTHHLGCTSCNDRMMNKPVSKVSHQPNCLCGGQHTATSQTYKCGYLQQCGGRWCGHSPYKNSSNSGMDYGSSRPNSKSLHICNLNKNQTSHNHSCGCKEGLTDNASNQLQTRISTITIPEHSNSIQSTKSTEVTIQSIIDSRQLTEQYTQPIEETTHSIIDSRQLTEQYTQPIEETTHSIIDSRQLTEQYTQPIEETTQSIIDSRQLTEQYTQPIEETTQSIIDSRQLTEPIEENPEPTYPRSLLPRFLEPWSFPVQPKRIKFFKH